MESNSQGFNFELLAARLTDPHSDLNSKLALANEIREHIEIVQSIQYPRFLSSIIPAFSSLLNMKLRKVLLEILQRLPYNDALKPYAPEIMNVVMATIKIDNEENTAICLRIIIELHKNFRNIPQLEEYVQPFFEFFKACLQMMPQNVHELIDQGLADMIIKDPNSNTPDMSDIGGRASLRSVNSFKVLAECPIILVLLFQIYKRFIASNIPELVPLLVQTIQIRASLQKDFTAVENENCIIGMNPVIINKTVYAEFFAAQVKIMSFLAYIIRGFSNLIKPHQQIIADSVVHLLMDCPLDTSSARKELLVAARHILSTDFRTSFIPFINVLFNEDLLIGTAITSKETLRPLAYSLLADLVHHVRQELSFDQISRTVLLYTQSLHDSCLAPSIQTMCAKLLLNMIDCIVAAPNKDDAKRLLVRILQAFSSKFSVLRDLIEKLVYRYTQKGESIEMNELLKDTKCLIDIEHLAPIRTSVVVCDHYTTDIAKDYKFLFKTLVLGLKTIVFGLKTVSSVPSATPGSPVVYKRTVQEEIELFSQLYQDGLLCFHVFQIDVFQLETPELSPPVPATPSASQQNTRPAVVVKEEKEILEHFVTIFTLVDAAVFHEVFQMNTRFFFEQLCLDSAMLAIPQYLLASEAVSRNFSSILLQYLMENLHELGNADPSRSTLILRLFKLVFMAVTLYPDANESVLQPHIYDLIMRSVKESATAKDSNNYFLLMRALFRNIGGGRFELLYKEVLPLLPFLLKSLNSLLLVAEKPQMRDLYVELCLTVPVRLSVLLPHLHHLMAPLVLSLDAGPELVSQGLRTLELCIDNLTAEFLDPILTPVLKEMMVALWRHLKPHPYNQAHSHATLRILGKLGGRNRRMLTDTMNTNFKKQKAPSLQVSVVFESSKPALNISLDTALESVEKIISDSISTETSSKLPECLEFLKSSIFLFVDPHIPENVVEKLREYANNPSSKLISKHRDLLQIKKETPDSFVTSYGPCSPHEKFKSQRCALFQILYLIMNLCTISATANEGKLLFKHIVTHFMLLKIASQHFPHSPNELDANIIFDVICETLISKNSLLRAVAEDFMAICKEVLFEVLQSMSSPIVIESFDYLRKKFSSACYKSEWYAKLGGARGLFLLIDKMDLGLKWALENQLEYTQALLYIFKDMSNELAAGKMLVVTETLMHTLKLCNIPTEEEDIAEIQQQKLGLVLSLLISELPNPNDAVRKNVQKAFALLAEIRGKTITEILHPLKERLSAPIFSKPLRALPFPMQIGNIDAMSYCISLSPPLIDFNDELLRLIQEAFALADAEDSSLTSRSSQLRNAELLTKLRTVCVKFLSIVLTLNEINSSPRFNNIRLRIAQLFFKCMYSKAPEVVDAAKDGLREAVNQQNKIPKELLQTGLRPILMNLSDYKRLTVEGLIGLGRLLELLTSYFKVEIGQKLLDHLQKWAQPAVLDNAASKPLNESNEIKIIKEILEVIRLLPAGSVVFLEEIVTTVIRLEEGIRRSFTSPFRVPLVKFIDRFAAESVEYFLQKLDDLNHMRLLTDLLCRGEASNFRSALRENVASLIENGFNSESSSPITRISATLIIHKMCLFDTNFLLLEPAIVESMSLEWGLDSSNLVPPDSSSDILIMNHRHRVASILLSYFKLSVDNFEVLFSLHEIYNDKPTLNYNFIKSYVLKSILEKNPEEFAKPLLRKLLTELNQDYQDYNQKKLLLFKYLLIPVLSLSIEKHGVEKILDQELKSLIHSRLWPFLPNDDIIDIEVRMEYLQLCALLVSQASIAVGDHRKDIIKYAWNFLKKEDSLVKLSAYVVLSCFIREYETPLKIIIQIFVTLLRSYQSESKLLVRQALDILVPSLKVRLKDEDGHPPCPTWVRWTRKILVDDTHLIPQLISIWQMIIRHPDVYYDYREQFIQQIVGSLAKLGLAPSATSDTKSLTLDLVELILKWEKFRIDAIKSLGEEMEIDHAYTSVHSFSCSGNIREMIINYLLRFLCMNNDTQHKKGRSFKITTLMEQFLDIETWKNANVKLAFLEKYLTSTDQNETTMPHVAHVLKTISMLLTDRSSEWYIENMSFFQILYEKLLTSEDQKIVDCVSNITAILFRKLQENQHHIASNFSSVTSYLHNQMSENLSSGKNVQSIVTILHSTGTVMITTIDALLPILCKILLKLAKEFPSIPTANHPLGIYTPLTCFVLEIIILRVFNLGENKKTFFAAFALLVDKGSDDIIQKRILKMVIEWVMTDKGSCFTAKEKSLMLLKFATLEGKCSRELFEEYLSHILKIYKEESNDVSEMTVRLEPVFLVGTRCKNSSIRQQFFKLFDKKLPRSLFARWSYVIGVQSWEYISTSFWIKQALEIVLGMAKVEYPLNRALSSNLNTLSLSIFDIKGIPTVKESLSSHLKEIVQSWRSYVQINFDLKVSHLFSSIQFLVHENAKVAGQLWKELFSLSWKLFSNKERHDLNKYYIALLSKEYHLRQAENRPNPMMCLMNTAAYCEPPMLMPPQVLRYIGKTFDCWHVVLDILERQMYDTELTAPLRDTNKVKELVMDSLSDLYLHLSEEDLYYGLWRKRALYPETNAALSFEQIGLWQQAQSLYESAQIKARNGLLPFFEAEYCLWEDRWICCTQKLQQWDLLSDLAKHDSNVNLQLECSWRITDWNSEKESLTHAVTLAADYPSPRQKVFESFLILSQIQENSEKVSDLQKRCDEGIQLALKNWHSLPTLVGSSHILLFQTFQQFVELQEASHIYVGLGGNSQNKLQIAQELKGTLGTWRDRLPNTWDDINIWSELVAWRQHVFSVINKAFQPLADHQAAMNSLAYRGYHEIAWIINRFAHVARKHHLTDVCLNALTKIYTLPNIEIQDAFLKLREQAKCYFDGRSDLANGLEVINNTNLAYFQPPQRAEFFAIKGIFLNFLNMKEEANSSFSAALHVDANLPKGWSAWAKFHDGRFQENPNDANIGADALNCYLQATGLYKNYRCRKYIARILWLLECDDQERVISKAFDTYKGELPTWYWISFIPQLLSGLGNNDAKHHKNMIIRIAKIYPQALYLHLRTLREDLRPLREQSSMTVSTPTPFNNTALLSDDPLEFTDNDGDISMNEGEKNSNFDIEVDQSPPLLQQPLPSTESSTSSLKEKDVGDIGLLPFVTKKAWEHLEDIMGILKTAYPLLALSIETMTDQMLTQLKPSPDEDVYRIVVALLTDGVQHLTKCLETNANINDNQIMDTMRTTIERFIHSPFIAPTKHKDDLQRDFIDSKPNLLDLMARYENWKTNLELNLAEKPKSYNLEDFSHYLVEFEHQRFDEVEVPGQYLNLRDNNSDFARIDRFEQEFHIVKGPGIWYRSLTFIGHDGTKHSFCLQMPSARHSRREERIMQLLRLWNDVLLRKKETRKRNITFKLPKTIPLNPTARIVEHDISNISMHDVLSEHCLMNGFNEDSPVKKYLDLLKVDVKKRESMTPEERAQSLVELKMDIYEQVSEKQVPETVLSNYMRRILPSFSDLWLVKQNFTTDIAAATFISYIMNVGHRLPHRFQISRSTGSTSCIDLLPLMNSELLFSNPEAVPFRLTPNMQHFITAVGIEGKLIGSILAITCALSEHESVIDSMLGLVVKEEIAAWKQISQPSGLVKEEDKTGWRELTRANCEIVKQAIYHLSCKEERIKTSQEPVVPVCQPLVELLSKAMDIQNLASMDPIWHPWF